MVINIKIKQAEESDLEAITDLFYGTVQHINKKDYTQQELDEWSSSRNNKEKWIKRINEQYFILVLVNDKVVGFSSIATDGYLDLMYTHRDFQAQGVAKTMLAMLEAKAKKQKINEIYSDVSITAKFFSYHKVMG